MVGKIELVEENNSYVLKVFLSSKNSKDPRPFMLFSCSYIDRPKEEALKQILEYRKGFSKSYRIPLEETMLLLVASD